MATEPKKRAPASKAATARPASTGGGESALEPRLKTLEAETSKMATSVSSLSDRIAALEKQLRDRPTAAGSGESPKWADKLWRQADYVGDQVRRNPLLSIALAIIVTALIFTIIG